MIVRWRSALASPSDRALLVSIAALAAAARVAALAAYGPRLGGDSHYYVETAERLGGAGPAAVAQLDLMSAPLYPVALALGALLLRTDPVTAAIVLQLAAGVLTVVLVVRIARRLSASRLAWILAGAVAALDPAFLFWGAYVLSETLFLLAVAFAADRATALAASRRPMRDGFVAALALFAALAARSTAIAFAAAVVVAMVVALGREPRRLLAAAAGGALALVLVLGAFVVSAGGPPGAFHAERVAGYVWSALYIGLEWTERGRGTPGIDLTGGPPDGDHRRAVIEWVTADPGFVVLQMLRKLRAFWTPVLPEFSARHAALNLAWYVPLYAAALNGLRHARRAEAGILVLGIAAFTAQAMITFVDYDQRFRLPAELLLVPLAAAGAAPVSAGAVRALRARRRRAAAGVPAPSAPA